MRSKSGLILLIITGSLLVVLPILFLILFKIVTFGVLTDTYKIAIPLLTDTNKIAIPMLTVIGIFMGVVGTIAVFRVQYILSRVDFLKERPHDACATKEMNEWVNEYQDYTKLTMIVLVLFYGALLGWSTSAGRYNDILRDIITFFFSVFSIMGFGIMVITSFESMNMEVA